MNDSLARRSVGGVLGALLLSLMLLPACSDDPILGPNEGEPSDDGGSYSSIQRLSPPSPTADSTTSPSALTFDLADANPERF
ncbi:hypothetical protein [Salinibacter altiplanensis]|uniref:hypothetical protein n=1 Tax=Salinibacter altiplanensis TaxID=1803181 RepID=UPI000C9F7B28|nr:hypothetical protein [Salinibacter altiplanensis]